MFRDLLNSNICIAKIYSTKSRRSKTIINRHELSSNIRSLTVKGLSNFATLYLYIQINMSQINYKYIWICLLVLRSGFVSDALYWFIYVSSCTKKCSKCSKSCDLGKVACISADWMLATIWRWETGASRHHGAQFRTPSKQVVHHSSIVPRGCKGILNFAPLCQEAPLEQPT